MGKKPQSLKLKKKSCGFIIDISLTFNIILFSGVDICTCCEMFATIIVANICHFALLFFLMKSLAAFKLTVLTILYIISP